jgi:hypothetical protein
MPAYCLRNSIYASAAAASGAAAHLADKIGWTDREQFSVEGEI